MWSRTNPRHAAVWAGTLLAAAWLSTARSAVAAEDPQLDEIRSSMRQYLTSLRSLATTFELSFEPDPTSNIPASEHPYGQQAWGPQSFERIDQGEQRLLTIGPIPLAGISPTRTWVSINNQRGYNVDFDPEDISIIRSIYRTTNLEEHRYFFRDMLSPAHLMGLEPWQTDRPLLELLAAAPSVTGAAELDGRPCPVIDFGEQPILGIVRGFLSVTFDPVHDHLPREWAYEQARKSRFSQPLDQSRFTEIIEVTEFQRVTDAALQVERWFPKACVWRTSLGTRRIVVTNVTWNVPIDGTKFAPEIPFGTEVISGPRVNGQPTKRHYHGGPKAVDAVMESRVAEANELRYAPSADAELVDASGGDELSLSFWLACLSFGGLVVTGVWHFRKRSG
jgi:hypothetical protein